MTFLPAEWWKLETEWTCLCCLCHACYQRLGWDRIDNTADDRRQISSHRVRVRVDHDSVVRHSFVLRFPLSYIWRPPFNTHIQVLDVQCQCELAIINIHTISFQFNSVEHKSKKMLPNADVCVVRADSQSVPLSNPPSSVRPVPRASSFYTSDIAGTPEKFKLIFYSPSLSARRFIWCCFFLVEI